MLTLAKINIPAKFKLFLMLIARNRWQPAYLSLPVYFLVSEPDPSRGGGTHEGSGSETRGEDEGSSNVVHSNWL